MRYTASNLLKIARAELGYHEKETNAHLDNPTANAGDGNYTKFARDLYAAGYYNGNKQGFAWCDMFVDWDFYMLCGKDPKVAQQIICQSGPYGAGCKFSAQYYKQEGRFYTENPMRGDQVFFRKYAHTGLVDRVTDKGFYTLEGNKGNQVSECFYPFNDPNIDGFGRPKYDPEVEEEIPVSPDADTDAAIAVGSIVTIVKGAVYTTGQKVPHWVRKMKWIVREVSGSRIVIDKSADGKISICSPIDMKYLIADKPYTPKVGDIVNFIGSKCYTRADGKGGKEVKPGKAKVTSIYGLGECSHPFHLVAEKGSGSTVFGWCAAKDITKV